MLEIEKAKMTITDHIPSLMVRQLNIQDTTEDFMPFFEGCVFATMVSLGIIFGS